jgi:outer membrane protein assembly factor BamA
MSRWLIATIIVLYGTSAPPARGQDSAEPQRCAGDRFARIIHGRSVRASKKLEIARLIFVGDPALPLPEQEKIATALTRANWTDNQDGLDHLRERIRDAWQEQGYFKAKVKKAVTQTLEDAPYKRAVEVTVYVDAGKQYWLGEIEFRQSAHLSAEQLRPLFPLQRGDVFDTHKLQKGIEEMRRAYGAKGFINFSTVPLFNINETTAVVSLTIEVEEGPQFRFGQVKVLGLDPALAQKLLHESGLDTGSIFDVSRVHEFFQRNRLILPKDASEIENTRRLLDQREGVVDITMDFRGCPLVAEE